MSADPYGPIESNIPIPTLRLTGLTGRLRQLELGDSFTSPKRNRGTLVTSAHRVGIKIVTRKVDDTTIRVWRVE